MKTEDLIAGLALEPGFPGPRQLERKLILWSGGGALMAALLTLLVLGPRPDMDQIAGVASFLGKAGYTLALAGAGLWLARRLGQPGARAKGPLLALSLLLVGGLIATVVELALIPAGERAGQLMGHSAMICPLAILGLGLLALCPAMIVARRLAPVRPAAAGAAIGLLAGGLSATAYGLHCAETAVSFLVIWYGLGVLATAALGAAIGARVLRW
ncbi:MAG: DUF1109 domain-containing protein [Phenylobacterium sp.]|uniref:DUF1109 domain-containing protein n=1 Tax=Phenylobacterium sp. TaxID=1871053 RepID=UPI0027362918|nr:DUF1109 domain-containing protein [Phenylobacterium sp.]MDP1643508.1 DUF1109 domain-containing protein [Phenylobacterium sp.]MDP3116881.1 DUF1109 domain-containing protein [Phenylobacterium sp.]MDP3384957.1 DUF1109 domain-containing protein [Phenylobacterium sp.]